MDFSAALLLLKAGRQIRRKGRSIWIYLDKYGQIRELDFDFGMPDTTLWEASQESLLATDWEVREPSST
jgi:hypothetical protein